MVESISGSGFASGRSDLGIAKQKVPVTEPSIPGARMAGSSRRTQGLGSEVLAMVTPAEADSLKVLSSYADESGLIRITENQVAADRQASTRTIRRHLAGLTSRGVLARISRGGGRGGGASVYQLVIASREMPDSCPYGNNPRLEGSPTTGPVVVATHSGTGSSIRLGVRYLVPRPDPPSPVAGTRLGLFSTEVLHLVAWFHWLTLPLARRAITSKRTRGWMRSAIEMLVVQGRPMDELVEMLAWIFQVHSGVLPFSAEKPEERHVTRLALVDKYYDQIREAMVYGGTKNPGVNYLYPLPDEQVEAQAVDLVSRFAAFRESQGYKASDYKLRGWAKTFRIMLANDGTGYDEIASVIDSLRAFERHLDLNGFVEAYWLRLRFAETRDYIAGLKQAYAKRDRHPVGLVTRPKPQIVSEVIELTRILSTDHLEREFVDHRAAQPRRAAVAVLDRPTGKRKGSTGSGMSTFADL